MELFTVLLVLTIIIIIITIYLSSYFENLYNTYNLSKQFIGPKAYPLIGNALLFSDNMEDNTKILLDIFDKYSYKNIPIRFWLGLKLGIIIYQPDCIKKILKHSDALEKSILYEFFKPLFGNGLFSSPVITWRTHRKILQPIFKTTSIRSFEDIIGKNIITLIKNLNNFNGKEINVLHHTTLCTLDIIYGTLLNYDLNLQGDPNNDLDESISCVMELSIERICKLWQHPDFIFYNTSSGKKLKKCLSSMDKITRKIIELKKKSMAKDQLTGTSTFESEGRKNNTFLDLIFSKEAQYSKQNIRDEINTMVVAGSDTVATGISFVFLMLANHPEIQSKIYDELFKIYDSSDPQDYPVKYEEVRNIEILDCVIKETMRLFPPAPIVARETTRVIKVHDQLIIPKNCTIVFGIFTTHRNESYWKDPLKFDPDRFLTGTYNPDCFIPFSSGPRGCIGRTLGIMVMKMIIANVLRKFIIKTENPLKVEDVTLKLAVTLKPAKPIILSFKKR